ncbi:hypothetical protein [Emticicia soli]|uniref:Outer membrane protein beta-barrel domain-containing protein n=1 Tax=Emticicia soli TaxID=2027878 RepID=A0ABW5JBF0_9BACT
MKKIILFLLLSHTLSAQYLYPATQRNFDLSVAFGSAFSPSLSYQNLYGIGKAKRFKIGWGIRLNTFFSGQKNYITAPARLTSGSQSIVALFTENIADNLDTLQLTKSRLGNVNGTIILQYSFKKLDIGFNIDFIGYSFGGKQTGKFIASESKSLHETIQTAKPTQFNLLLISDSDIGSLNSELYFRYRISNKLGLRAGASFQFLEYTTDKTLTFENDRFRHKTLLPFVAITYTPIKKTAKNAR